MNDEIKCPKCDEELMLDFRHSDGLAHEFFFCEMCQLYFNEEGKEIIWVSGHFKDKGDV